MAPGKGFHGTLFQNHCPEPFTLVTDASKHCSGCLPFSASIPRLFNQSLAALFSLHAALQPSCDFRTTISSSRDSRLLTDAQEPGQGMGTTRRSWWDAEGSGSQELDLASPGRITDTPTAAILSQGP